MGTMSLRTLCYNEHPGRFGFTFCEFIFRQPLYEDR
jgi:hypothetical protein